jgi:phosphohistidine phosphatase SixA
MRPSFFNNFNGHVPRRAALLLGVSLLAACTSKTQVPWAAQSSFGPPPASSNPEPLVKGPQAIAALLAKGGYIIYMRHGRTQYDQIELERTNRANGSWSLDRCETQRQLSEEGRAEMKATGEQFRAARIPLDKAFSSRYCRATQSAAFFVDGAEPTQSLSGEGEVGLNPANKPRTLAFLSQVPAPGKNTYMMAHGGVFWEATGFVIQEGNAVVLDPNNLKVIMARIGPQEWGSIAQARRP